MRSIISVVAVVGLTFGVTACSSSSSSEPSPSVTQSATDTPTSPVSPTSTATVGPTNASGSPTGSIQSLNLSVSATTAKPGDRINLNVSGPKSLAGKQVAIVDMIAPDKYKIFSTLTLNSNGAANGYLVLGVNDEIQALVPTNPVQGNLWNPGQPVLAESGLVQITVQ